MGSITIKGGSSFDAPWIVVDAPEDGSADSKVAAQRAYILAVFGMSADDPDIKDLTLAEVVAQASYHFQGTWAKAGGGGNRRSGGRKAGSANLGNEQAASEEPKAEPSKTAEAAGDPDGNLPSGEPTHEEAVATVTETLKAEVVEDTPAEAPHQDVLDEIAGASSKKELQAIYFAHQADAMKDGSVLAALQARTKEVG